MMLAFKDQPAVDFIGEHKNIAIANHAGDLLQIALVQHSTCGIVRRI